MKLSTPMPSVDVEKMRMEFLKAEEELSPADREIVLKKVEKKEHPKDS